MTSKYDTDDYALEFTVSIKRTTPMEPCSSCNGNGFIADYYYMTSYKSTCNDCKGIGKVYIREAEDLPEIPQKLIDDLKAAWVDHNHPIVVCDKCNGRGQWDDADIGDISCNHYFCDNCEGTGKVRE